MRTTTIPFPYDTSGSSCKGSHNKVRETIFIIGEDLLLKLILVRHGQTLWNREKRVQGVSDIELSNRGKAQAEKLARSLQHERIETIVSSPLKRAVQTAEAINCYHRLRIELLDELMELDQGDFEGMAFPELMKQHGDFLKRWVADPASVVMPQGESLGELQNRAWGAVERIVEKSKNTLVVSHNFTIMTILCKINNRNLSHVREVHVDTASKTVVNFENGSGTVIRFNDVDYLAGCEDVID